MLSVSPGYERPELLQSMKGGTYSPAGKIDPAARSRRKKVPLSTVWTVGEYLRAAGNDEQRQAPWTRAAARDDAGRYGRGEMNPPAL
jgi:hypothetical protein